MTLSGKSDRRLRLEAARAARQQRGDASRAKRPWLVPLIVVVAAVVLIGAIGYAVTSGISFF